MTSLCKIHSAWQADNISIVGSLQPGAGGLPPKSHLPHPKDSTVIEATS